ncbi:MAG: heavy metal-associated domain-containing protein [Fermentimonas sp.]|jgi:copper chaperone CopZ|nr:heavy metal-associated domain-containing protein [Fermentimonas sp.]MDD2931060.1 heavy metal-associated domain-containing protein [Fermentimonas sp.]MDD3189063.1 heavy metal-associated domain-containing protein [Fermentimonas sp.]MDD3511912.1 heavy metal-associated domain-containing protein [Fermentimonas sp.]MDD4284902.1 heavy metal-associated domain-containing protein [Fermentimonas sp.]
MNTINKIGENNMKSVTIQLETLTCPSCVQKIEVALKGLEGVDKESVKVMFNASKAKAYFDDDKVSVEQLEESIAKMGYEVKNSKVKSV